MLDKQIESRYSENFKYVKDVSLVFNLYVCLCRREFEQVEESNPLPFRKI